MTKCQHYSLELDSTAAKHAHKQNVADWEQYAKPVTPLPE